MNSRKKINIIKMYADQNEVVYKETKKGLLIPLEEDVSSKRTTIKDIMNVLVTIQQQIVAIQQQIVTMQQDIANIKQDIEDMKNTPTMKKELGLA